MRDDVYTARTALKIPASFPFRGKVEAGIIFLWPVLDVFVCFNRE